MSDVTNPQTSSEDARERIAEFVRQYPMGRGVDPEVICNVWFDAGAKPATLTISDLRAVLAADFRNGESRPAVTEHDGGRVGCNHAGGICSEPPAVTGEDERARALMQRAWDEGFQAGGEVVHDAIWSNIDTTRPSPYRADLLAAAPSPAITSLPEANSAAPTDEKRP